MEKSIPAVLKGLATIATDLKEVQPTMMSAVPRLLEKIYLKVKETGKKNKGIKRAIFFWALNLAERYKIDDLADSFSL